MSTLSPRLLRSRVSQTRWFRAVELIVLASVAIALSSKAALGQIDYFWNQNAAAGPQDWNNGANWNPAGPPMGGDGNNAHIGLGGTATITSAQGTTPSIDSVLFDDVMGGTVNQSSDTLALAGTEANADPAGPGRLRIGAVNPGAFGTYNLTGTGIVTAARIQVGETGGGAAPVSTFKQGVLADAGTTSVTLTQSLDIGGAAGGAVGDGVYTLNSGTLTVGSDGTRSLSVGNNVGSVGVMNINGGTLVSQSAQIGNGGTGTVNQTGGTTTFNQGPGNWFAVGGSTNGASGGSGTGTYNLSGGTMTVNNWLFLGNSNGAAGGTSTGTFSISGNASLNSPWIGVGRDTTGIFNQSGNTTVTFNSRILIGGVDGGGAGLGTAQGTYNMMGGTLIGLASTNFNVGQLGKGVFNQTGGTVNHDGFPLTIGATNNVTSNGEYDLSGTGVLNIATNGGTNGATDFYVANGNNSTGLLNQSGGTLTQAAGRFQIGSGSNSNGTYRMSGGTASFGDTWVGQGNGATALIQQSGGTVNYGGGNGLVMGWGGNAASNSTYNLSGPTTGANKAVVNGRVQMAWNGNATFNQSGGVVNATGAGVGFRNGTGVYNLSGGILNTAAVAKGGSGNATFNFNGGTLSPTASTNSFLQGLDTANVQAGGAVFDTNGSQITVAQTLLHDTTIVPPPPPIDGGLTLTDSNTTATGSLTLTGANTYNGTTRVVSTAGALGPATLFLGNALAVQNSTVQMTAGLNNSVQFNGGIGAFTFGGLSGSANLSLTDLGAGAITLSVGNNNSETTYSGVLGTAADGANLIKIGSGTLHLTGTQLYTGTTRINGGTLSLNGASASLANSSSVDVGGANAIGSPTLLAQSGANAGKVHVHGPEATGAAGSFAAGDINTAHATSLQLDAGANVNFVLGTPGVGGAGVTADLITVTNALTLPVGGGVIVNLTDNANAGGLGSFGLGTYKIITEGSTANFTTSSFSVGSGVSGFQEKFTNTGGTEIDMVVTTAPTWSATPSGTPNTDWAQPGNWQNNLVPGVHDGTTTNTDLASFSTASTVLTPMPDANRNVQNITFDTAAAGAYVIGTTGGNALLLTAGGTIQTTGTVANTQTVNAPLILEGANASYAFASNSADNTKLLNFGGGITGGAAGNTVLTLTGTNKGNNTISGIIADGSATVALVKSGIGKWVLNKAETYSGGTTILVGTLQLGDGTGNGSVIGPITDAGTLAFANANPQTFANAISGGGALTVAGAGALTLTSANSISGLTTINAGSTLILGDGVANNGSVAGNILDNGTLTFANPNSLTNAGSISGSGPVTVSGPGPLTFSIVNTYGGSTTISANGTLNLSSAVAANILPAGTAVTMNGSAVLDMSGVVSDQTIGSLASASATATVNLGTNNLITGGNGGSTVFAGTINGVGGLIKNGAGTFTLSNANSYVGDTVINAGAVQLNHANAAQNSTVRVGAANGLKFGPGVGTFNIGGLAGGSNFSLTDTGSAPVTLNAGLNGADSTYSGILGGAGVLSKVGSGKLTLSGNNSYSGGTVVSAGTLSATTVNTALGTGRVTMSGGTLQLTGGVKNAISINFEGGTGLAPTKLAATDVAGVYPVVNWNNVNSTGVGAPPGGPAGSNNNIDSPTAKMIVDKNGTATAATISFMSDHPDAVSSGVPLTTGNVKLMNGYLGVNQFVPAASLVNVSVASVPFPLYDAYVYFGSRNDFGQRTPLHITVDTTSVYGMTNDNPFTGFVQATGTGTGDANNSDYALFPLLTDATFAATLQVDATQEAGVHGIQLVESANPSLTYANNVTVTSDSTIDVSGPAAATLGTLSIGSNKLSVTGASFATDQPYTLNLGATTLSGDPTFDVANNGAGTGTLRVASLSTGGSGRTITKANSGTMEIQGASNLSGGSTINVSAGTLRFNNTTGAATIGAGSTVNVSASAVLELAGTFSDLSSTASAASRLHIVNSGSLASSPPGELLVSGTHQQVGAIDGTGDTVVNSGGNLTANHIIQNSLVIGGTADSAGLVTIAASDAAGNPTASGLALAGSLTPSGPFGAGNSSASLADGLASSGSDAAGVSSSSALPSAGLSTVPEPSAIVLSAFALAGLLIHAISRRRSNLPEKLSLFLNR